ncbi:hypothetical protein [Dyadobacter sp. CY312]|uniref:hypothetical protein n=1 Tax=Dyadobacter sp. CY312 TaxID=2907303 RepID=UPI001F433776|nr:hypothetical protein [Dyadobacter sp. CY312]MCE7040838.1 hypothetical protein [Dyadobacter sp. CY312]
MNLPGIKTEYTAKGNIKRVIIDGTSDSELVEDILDMIAIEAAKGDEYVPWEEVKAELNKIHGIDE